MVPMPDQRLCAGVVMLLLGVVSVSPGRAAEGVGDAPSAETSRTFRFTYAATVKDVPAGRTARIWLPVPTSGAAQSMETVRQRLPAEARVGTEPRYGNRILYLEAEADARRTIALSVTYRVTRHEVQADFDARPYGSGEIDLFLKPNAKVPVGGKPVSLLAGKRLPEDQLRLGRVLYDVVGDHMRYSKDGTGWGRGDAVWACDSRFGNCSDFHSLFISLCRSQKVPARFEIGFALPEVRGAGEVDGYHCWAEFKPRKRPWIPVDISEADKNPKLRDYYFGNLSENRVAFSVGRDLQLVPKQDGEPLNFFIYPYVEIDGKPWPQERIETRFRYRDVGADR